MAVLVDYVAYRRARTASRPVAPPGGASESGLDARPDLHASAYVSEAELLCAVEALRRRLLDDEPLRAVS